MEPYGPSSNPKAMYFNVSKYVDDTILTAHKFHHMNHTAVAVKMLENAKEIVKEKITEHHWCYIQENRIIEVINQILGEKDSPKRKLNPEEMPVSKKQSTGVGVQIPDQSRTTNGVVQATAVPIPPALQPIERNLKSPPVDPKIAPNSAITRLAEPVTGSISVATSPNLQRLQLLHKTLEEEQKRVHDLEDEMKLQQERHTKANQLLEKQFHKGEATLTKIQKIIDSRGAALRKLDASRLQRGRGEERSELWPYDRNFAPTRVPQHSPVPVFSVPSPRQMQFSPTQWTVETDAIYRPIIPVDYPSSPSKSITANAMQTTYLNIVKPANDMTKSLKDSFARVAKLQEDLKKHIDAVRDIKVRPADLEAMISTEIINHRDADGKTLLHHAAESARGPAVIKMLLAKGAKIDLEDENGNTPLHAAALSNAAAPLTALLDNNARTDLLNKQQKTAFQCVTDDKLKRKIEVWNGKKLLLAQTTNAPIEKVTNADSESEGGLVIDEPSE